MLIVPWATDAPVYHRPWATIGLIVANVLVFLLELNSSPYEIVEWTLWFGDGIHPLQWVSSHFMHAGFMHLAGNMLFLWVFGLVVEGKLGWWRFLALYEAIGITQAAVVQVAMLGARESVALGASSAIFGIMAIAALWAPRNRVDVFVWFLRPWTFEMPMLAFLGLFIGWDVFSSIRTGFEMSTATLHASGAAIGAPLGVLLLRKRWVDCEGWDLLTLWGIGLGRNASEVNDASRRAVQATPQERRASPVAAASPRAERTGTPTDPVAILFARAEAESAALSLAAAGDGAGAVRRIAVARRAHGQWPLGAPTLRALARQHLVEKAWEDASATLRELLERFPADGDAATRLNLAQALLIGLDRPRAALEILEPLRPEALSPKQQALLAQLRQRAAARAEAGVLELDG